jgi:hypothetical protein
LGGFVERTGDEFGSRASDGGGATERVFSRMQSIDFNMRCGGGQPHPPAELEGLA